MLKTLKDLCGLYGPSGNENAVREYIIGEIKDFCSYRVDNLGNLIAEKKGKKTPNKKIMVDAHMDEVGFIITNIDADGFLRFDTIGGIEPAVMVARRVTLLNGACGVVGTKPVHLTDKSAAKKFPKTDELYIDIGAKTREEALGLVSLGEAGVFDADFIKNGDNLLARAIDDRAGCAVLIDLIKSETEYDFTAVFSVQEEVGLRGARVATYSVDPHFAIVLEATTAADIPSAGEGKKVCFVGCGPAVSFMDRSTVYDRKLYDFALNKSGVLCQPKTLVAGGNNSGAVHLSKEGVRTIAVSVPCRYLHTPSCVSSFEDIKGARALAEALIREMGANSDL